MFGNKHTAAIDETERYMRSMFTGLHSPEENALSEKTVTHPYVTGFLQVLTMHSVATVYHGRMPEPDTINDIMAAALDRIGPGYGKVMRSALAEASDPAHSGHSAYLTGRRDGAAHVRTLLATDEIAHNEPYFAFRAYVQAHCL